MKQQTLYVSDLDGTLLNSKKEITPFTANILNQCLDKGMKFAVATARMPYGCDYRLKTLRMDTPGILTNGVFLYDFKNETVISAEIICPQSAKEVIQAFTDFQLGCFVYTYAKGEISIFYNQKELEAQTQYYSKQAIEKCNAVKLTNDLEDAFASGDIAYITHTGAKESLEPLCSVLDKIPHISYSFYLNVYNGWYCLEIFSDTASKKNALKKLQNMLGSKEIVVFGDNLNDLSMIEIAQRSYAPANALDEVKQVVTVVLDDCNHDGVAKFLATEFNL